MDYKIIGDSCVDFNEDVFTEEFPVSRVPFIVTIDGEEYIDKDELVINELRKRDYKAETIRTACPSPNDFFMILKEAKNAFVVTISSKLSGAYQSAMTALDMLKEEYEIAQKIHIFDSETAAAGETLVALQIRDLIAEDLSFDEIVAKTNAYIEEMKTYFSLESLDTLESNGRVSVAKKFAVKALKLFPIMGDNGKGEIELKTFTRGKDNALPKLIETIGEDKEEYKNRRLGITHVDALEKAEYVKSELEKTHSFKEILIFEAGGLSSVYAGKGGIVLAF